MSRPISPIMVAAPAGGPADYLAYLYKRKQIVAALIEELGQYLLGQRGSPSNLIHALAEYLYDNIDDAIARMEAPPPDYRPQYTVEDLVQAQQQVSQMEAAIEALEKMCADLEEHGSESSAEFMRTSQLPALEMLIEPARARVADIQKALEEPAPDPSNPWPGTHRIGTLCANCAKPFHGLESSPKKLRVVLLADGWRRDPDGDWICAACVEKAAAGNTMRGESTGE